MSNTALDLWGEDFTATAPDSPVLLLREQARHLGARTDGRVIGDVAVYAHQGMLGLELRAVTPAGQVLAGLVRLRQTGAPYPVEVGWGDEFRTASNIDELREALAEALSSREVRLPIEALLTELAARE